MLSGITDSIFTIHTKKEHFNEYFWTTNDTTIQRKFVNTEMDTSKTSTLSRFQISKADFRFSVSNISTLQYENCKSSDLVVLRGFPWCIELRRFATKSNDSSEDTIGIGLICKNTDDTPNWSCSASAVIKLRSFSPDEPSRTHILEPSIFSAERRSRVLKKFINWTDLIDASKNYVNDDKIELDINIKVGVPNTTNLMDFVTMDTCCANTTMIKFRLQLNKIEELMIVQSPPFTVRNMPWEMYFSQVEKIGFHGYLKIALCCKHKDASSKWSCETTLTVRLLTQQQNMDAFERSIDLCVMCNEKPMLEMRKFIAWNQLIDPQNGFVENDAILLDIEIKTGKIKFVPPKPKERRTVARQHELNCPSCARNMLGQTVSATNCGHLFCTVCIEECIKQEKFCVCCNKKIKPKKLRQIALYR